GEKQCCRDISYPDFRDYIAESTHLVGAFGHRVSVANLSTGGKPERIVGLLVTGAYFDVIGVRAELGRVLRPDDDLRPGAHPVIVISHSLWTRRFGASAGIVGTVQKFNGLPYEIVGIRPPEFHGTSV